MYDVDHNGDHLEIYLDNFGEERFRCFCPDGIPCVGLRTTTIVRTTDGQIFSRGDNDDDDNDDDVAVVPTMARQQASKE